MNYKSRIFLESVVARALYGAADDVSLFLESKSPHLPMLLEALGEDDMEKLAAQVSDAKKDFDSLKELLGNDLESMQNISKVLDRIEKSFPSPAKIAALNLAGSKKGIAKKVSQAALAIDSLNAARTSILNATSLLSSELGKLAFVKEVEALPDTDPRKISFDKNRLDDFMEEYATEDDMPSYKNVKAGIKRSYKPAKPADGWLGKASELLGLGTPKLSSGAFVRDIEALSFGRIMALGRKASEVADDASSETVKDDEFISGIGDRARSRQGQGSEDTPTPQIDDKETLGSIGDELVAAVGQNNAQAFVDVATGKRKLSDLPPQQQAIVRAAMGQFEKSSDDDDAEPEQVADEVAAAAEEAGDNVIKFPNIERLAALGKQRFGDNGDILIKNFFADDRVRKAFGVNESTLLEVLLFEAEDDEQVKDVEFDELLPIAMEVGEDIDPDVEFDEDELASYFDAATEEDLLPRGVKRIRRLNVGKTYQYTVQSGKNKGNTRKVKVVGTSARDGYYQAQLQKKDGKFTNDEYSLPVKGFGEMINESPVDRWKVLAGVR